MHVLVDQHPLRTVDAAAEKPDEVPVLELGYQLHLVLEFPEPLRRPPRQPLHRYVLPIPKLALRRQSISIAIKLVIRTT